MKFSWTVTAACGIVGSVVIALAASAPAAISVTMTDVTAQAGIKFTHNAGKSGKKFLPETLGSGAAFIGHKFLYKST